MINENQKVGDLIHIPANVELLRYSSFGWIDSWKVTKEPISAILLEECGVSQFKIYIEGEFWIVSCIDIFETGEN